VYLWLVVAVLVFPYFIIGLLITAYGNGRSFRKDYDYRPPVTLFIPTFNEERHIRTKLDNLLSQTYPISEILVIDCSTDQTRQIVEEYRQKYPIINLVQQPERLGNARTLNLALREASGEIVVKTDCDSLTRSNTALAELIADFADPKIGGATGILVNTMEIEGNFRQIMTRIQVAESNLDSTVVAHGPSLVGYRKTASSDVDPRSMGDDTEEFIVIRRAGYRTVVDPSVVSVEEVPTALRTRRAQKTRRAEGIVGAILNNKDMLLRPRFGKFGMVVLPSELFILAISPVVLLVLLPTLFFLAFTISLFFFYACATIFVLIVVWKRQLVLAVADTQLNSFIGSFKAIFFPKEPLWKKVR
jgi:cellulose synthase/poly-beta-1,6-N-acetylglucosamine synthase-like glycosyltransferase